MRTISPRSSITALLLVFGVNTTSGSGQTKILTLTQSRVWNLSLLDAWQVKREDAMQWYRNLGMIKNSWIRPVWSSFCLSDGLCQTRSHYPWKGKSKHTNMVTFNCIYTFNISGWFPSQPLHRAVRRGILWSLLQLPRQAGDAMNTSWGSHIGHIIITLRPSDWSPCHDLSAPGPGPLVSVAGRWSPRLPRVWRRYLLTRNSGDHPRELSRAASN